MYLVNIASIELAVRKWKGKDAFMEIIMTEQGNKSWASRQFHLELFPAALNLVTENPNPITMLAYMGCRRLSRICNMIFLHCVSAGVVSIIVRGCLYVRDIQYS